MKDDWNILQNCLGGTGIDYDAKKQAATYSKELLEEFGDRVKLQTYAIISIGFDRLLYQKL